MTENSDVLYNASVGLNHPDYENSMMLYWPFIRDSFEGEERIKANAQEAGYITIPAGLRVNGNSFESFDDKNLAVNYVKSSRYPEVCKRAAEIATGRAVANAFDISGDSRIIEDLDNIWADGQSFETNVIRILEEAITIRNGGLFVNLDKEGNPSITLYPAEMIPNWRDQGGETILVVLQDGSSSEVDDVFDHEVGTDRIVLRLDKDSGHYYMQRWSDEGTEFAGSKISKWRCVSQDEKDADEQGRVFPKNKTEYFDYIPFVPIGGWHVHQPPLKALANSAISYFKAYAEYAHAMWWCASPTPVFSFGKEGALGLSEPNYEEQAAASGASQVSHEIAIGDPRRPIILTDGKFSIESAPSGALGELRQRVDVISKEIAGMGARAFGNDTGGNKTAETERLQQVSENAVIWLVMREVENAITQAVNIAADWSGYTANFQFKFSDNTSFETFNFDDVFQMVELVERGYATPQNVVDKLIQGGVVPKGTTYEEIQSQLQQSRLDIPEDGDEFTDF